MSILRVDGLSQPAPHVRDLASLEIWERSLTRSRQRRRLAEIARRSRRRRKSASLAVSAALAAAPVVSRGVAAADPGSGSAPAGTTDNPTDGPLQANAQRVVLHKGSEGPLVAAAQRRLNDVLPFTHLAVDGIFGPLTRGAVMDFQHRHGLKRTGAIDVRTWAVMFKAPVVVMGDPAGAGGSGSDAGSGQPAPASASAGGSTQFVSNTTSVGAGSTAASPPARAETNGRTSDSGAGSARAASTASNASTGSGSNGGGGSQPVVVAPSNPSSQPSTYVLADGVALPLPRGYITGGSVDQGVDYSAPGGTPLYAMGDGVIIGEGISGFGPNAPILEITSGPLKGMEIYYGHAGPNLVHVGQHVSAGQQISIVGYGIVGISTGPHLEIGFYPPGPNGAGSRMLSLINGLMSQHPGGRVWGSHVATAHATRSQPSNRPVATAHAAADAPSQPNAPRASAAHASTGGGNGTGGSSGRSSAGGRGSGRPDRVETRSATMQAAGTDRSRPAPQPATPESTVHTDTASSGDGSAAQPSAPSQTDGSASASSGTSSSAAPSSGDSTTQSGTPASQAGSQPTPQGQGEQPSQPGSTTPAASSSGQTGSDSQPSSSDGQPPAAGSQPAQEPPSGQSSQPDHGSQVDQGSQTAQGSQTGSASSTTSGDNSDSNPPAKSTPDGSSTAGPSSDGSKQSTATDDQKNTDGKASTGASTDTTAAGSQDVSQNQ